MEAIQTGGDGVSVDPTTGQAFLPHESDGTVTVVDTTTRKVIKTITVGGHSGFGQVAIGPTAGLAYAAGVGGGGLAVVDTKTLEVVAEIPFPEREYYWSAMVGTVVQTEYTTI